MGSARAEIKRGTSRLIIWTSAREERKKRDSGTSRKWKAVIGKTPFISTHLLIITYRPLMKAVIGETPFTSTHLLYFLQVIDKGHLCYFSK